jgi:hypothetical protein
VGGRNLRTPPPPQNERRLVRVVLERQQAWGGRQGVEEAKPPQGIQVALRPHRGGLGKEIRQVAGGNAFGGEDGGIARKAQEREPERIRQDPGGDAGEEAQEVHPPGGRVEPPRGGRRREPAVRDTARGAVRLDTGRKREPHGWGPLHPTEDKEGRRGRGGAPVWRRGWKPC